MHYHAIILTGKNDDQSGRSIAGYRLRTAAKKYGFNLLVIDSSAQMNITEVEEILKNVITSETLALCVSAQLINRHHNNSTSWMSNDFFNKFKKNYSNIPIVIGGIGGMRMPGSYILYKAADWYFTGYSDESFPRLLKKLRGDSDHELKYMIENGKKRVDSDKFHRVTNIDDLETVLEIEDDFQPYQPIPLELSRGCIFKCSYCSSPFQGAKDYDEYMRSVNSIASELRRNYELFKTTRYTIMDDTFNDSIEKLDRLERAVELAKLPNFEFTAYIRPEILATKPSMKNQLFRMGFKGGFCGIESLNNKARKSVGRGMDINRVLDSIRDLTSLSSDIKMGAGNIIGLPGDTLADIHRFNEFYIKNKDSLFPYWQFLTLGIWDFNKNTVNEAMSDFEKDPEKFGYRLSTLKPLKGRTPGEIGWWVSNDMSYIIAKVLAENLSIQNQDHIKAGGWILPSFWHLNETKENIDNELIKNLKHEQRTIDSMRERSVTVIKRFT